MSKKTIEPTPSVEKITETELKDLQELIGQLNQSQLQVGQLETQKVSLLNGVADLQGKLKTFQDVLEQNYGKVSINITDGSIQELEEQK